MSRPPRDSDVIADGEWLRLLNEKLAKRGAKTNLAAELGVNHSTISRLAQGTPMSPELMYRASKKAGIRPPNLLEPTEWHGRLLRAFTTLHEYFPEKMEVLVVNLEERAQRAQERRTLMLQLGTRLLNEEGQEHFDAAWSSFFDVEEAEDGQLEEAHFKRRHTDAVARRPRRPPTDDEMDDD